MKRLKETTSNKQVFGCLAVIIPFLLIMAIAINSPGNKKESTSSPKLAAHRVINVVEDITPVSVKYFVSLMVGKDIKRQELKALLIHHMNKKVSAPNSKKYLIYVYAYTDSLRYERGEQWVGMLQLNEFQKTTPIITYDEVNLADGTLKKANIAGVNDPLREKMYYDVSDYYYEASLIMEDKHPMSVNEQITFMQNDSNRNKYLAEEESVRNKLIRYYMKKHNLTQAQFDILLDEGTEKNWTQKSVEESEKIRFIYRKFMK